MGFVGLQAQLQALQVGHGLDWAAAVGDVARAQLHPAQGDEALVLQLLVDRSADRAVDHPKRRLAVAEHERQADCFEFGHDARQEGAANPGQCQRARAHGVNVFLGAAQLHGGKHVDLQLVAGQARDFLLEHLVDGNAAGVFSGEVAGNLQLLLCERGRAEGQRCCRAGGQGEAACQLGERGLAVHGESPFRFSSWE